MNGQELSDNLRLEELAREYPCGAPLSCGEGSGKECDTCYAAGKLFEAHDLLGKDCRLDAVVALEAAARRINSAAVDAAIALVRANTWHPRTRRSTSVTSEQTGLPHYRHRFWRMSNAEQAQFLAEADLLAAQRRSRG